MQVLAALAAALVLVAPSAVVAVHFGSPVPALFELGDGVKEPTTTGSADIVNSTSQPGPDWENLFDANGNVVLANVSAFGGLTATFLKDPTSAGSSTDNTTFSSTSDKNDHAIPTWTWNNGSIPAKDDLANTYAYAVVNASGHLIVYVGVERLDPSGDSHMDIEFFQSPVHLDEAVPCNDPGPDATPCHFVGNRTNHDVLVSMDYTRGGDLGTVVVHLFNATSGVYDEVESIAGEGCNGLLAASLTQDSICAFNNGGSIDGGPWPNYDRHGKVIASLPKNAFTEFGLDLTNAAGGSTPCISTILAKTRSSQEFTAELKDFAGPLPFEVCGAHIRIEPDGVNVVGQPHTFNVTVNATIAGVSGPAPPGTPVNVTLTNSGGANATILSETCSAGTVGGTCNITFTSPTPGNVTGHAAADVSIGGTVFHVETDGTGANSRDAVKVFVGRPIMKVTEFGYTNIPNGTSTAGVVNGTATYKVRVKNFGNAAGSLSMFLNISAPGGLGGGTLVFNASTGNVTSAPPHLTSCDPLACQVSGEGIVLAPGAEANFTASVDYNNAGDGTVIRGVLEARYAASGVTRDASGSPATVDFTVQAD